AESFAPSSFQCQAPVARLRSVRVEYCVMKISDMTCPKCGSSYLMAECASNDGAPGQEVCSVCGNTLAMWNDRHRKAFRLVLSPKLTYPLMKVRRLSKPSRRSRPRLSVRTTKMVPSAGKCG